jgi:hypothetical protein
LLPPDLLARLKSHYAFAIEVLHRVTPERLC